MTITHVRPSRRAVVRGAAWSVPVISVAAVAPAFAASCGSTDYTFHLDWGTTDYDTTRNGSNRVVSGVATVVGPAGAQSVDVTFTSSVFGVDRRTVDNMTVDDSYTNIGALGAAETGLILQNTNILVGRDASRQTVTIVFSRAVTGLAFTITDIDSNNAAGNGQGNDFWDRVELTGTRNGVATPFTGPGGGVYVQGNGTTTTPWQMRADNIVSSDEGDNRGNIGVTYTAPVTQIDLTYWNARGTGNQAIFLSDFSFTAKGC